MKLNKWKALGLTAFMALALVACNAEGESSEKEKETQLEVEKANARANLEKSLAESTAEIEKLRAQIESSAKEKVFSRINRLVLQKRINTLCNALKR